MNLANNEILRFPEEQVLREGSTVMFCCIYSTQTNINSMYFNDTAYKVINISPQVKAIRVENINVTNTYGVNFYCGLDSDAVVNFVTCEYLSSTVQYNFQMAPYKVQAKRVLTLFMQ